MTASAGVAGVMLFGTTAFAATENAGAFGLQVTGPVKTLPTPDAECGTASHNLTAVAVTVPSFGKVGALKGSCTPTTSHGEVASADALAGQLTASVIKADCGPTGASSQFVGKVAGINIADSAYHDINIPGVARVQINESAGLNAAGETVQNAVHVTLVSALKPLTTDIYLAQARCKVTSGPVIPEVKASVLLPITALGVFGTAMVVMRRRRTGEA